MKKRARRTGPRETRGSQLLTKVLQDTRQEAVAEAISRALGRKIHQSSVSSWATWRHMPQGQAMVAMQRLYGIPVDSWAMPPAKESDPGVDEEEPAAATGTDSV